MKIVNYKMQSHEKEQINLEGSFENVEITKLSILREYVIKFENNSKQYKAFFSSDTGKLKSLIQECYFKGKL